MDGSVGGRGEEDVHWWGDELDVHFAGARGVQAGVQGGLDGLNALVCEAGDLNVGTDFDGFRGQAAGFGLGVGRWVGGWVYVCAEKQCNAMEGGDLMGK